MSQLPEKPIIGLRKNSWNNQDDKLKSVLNSKGSKANQLKDFPDINGYTPICLCGQGAYGQVWLVHGVTGKVYALKIVSKKSVGGGWKREFSGLVTYQEKVKRHPNLIEIYHIEEYEDFFYYTMECADNIGDDGEYIPSTLEHWVQKFGKVGTESLVEIFSSILDGLEFLHDSGVIHRDIKPDNIIFVDSVPKLSDIGLVASVSMSISLAGTQPYLPPEVILNGDEKVSTHVDVYALGKCLYRASTGNPPEKFPAVPTELLKDKYGKLFNRLFKLACSPQARSRLKDTQKFRLLLTDSVDIRTTISLRLIKFVPYLRFLKKVMWFIWLFNKKIRWFYYVCLILIAVFLIRCLFLFSIRTFVDGGRADFYSYWNIVKDETPHKVKYPLNYIFSSDFRRRERERPIRAKLSGTIDNRMGAVFSVGDEKHARVIEGPLPAPKKLHGAPMAYKAIYNYTVDKGDSWQVNGNSIILDGKTIRLMGNSSGALSLSKASLSNEYDISFKINFNRFQGQLTLGVTAEEYLPGLNKVKYKSSLNSRFYFDIKSSGRTINFSPILYRRQDYTNSQTENVCRTEAIIANQDKYYKFNIVMTVYYLRVYCDGTLIYLGPSTFHGGIFDIKYNNDSNSAIYIEDLEIKDIRKAEKDKNEPEYKLPSPLKSLKLYYNESNFPKSKLIFSDRLFNSNKWSTEMLRGKAKETSNGLELYLLANMTKTLDIDLPENFELIFNADIKSLDGFIAFDFIKPNNSNDVDGFLFFLSKNGSNEPLICPGIKLKNNNKEEIYKYSSPKINDNSLLRNCTLRVVKQQQQVQLYLDEIKMLDFSANNTKHFLPSKVKFRLRTKGSTNNYILLKNFCLYDLGHEQNKEALPLKEHKTVMQSTKSTKKTTKEKADAFSANIIEKNSNQIKDNNNSFINSNTAIEKKNTTKISEKGLKKSSREQPPIKTSIRVRKRDKKELPPAKTWSTEGKTKLKHEISTSHINHLKQLNRELTETQKNVLRNKLSGLIDKRQLISMGGGIKCAKDTELPDKNNLENCPRISEVEYDSNLSEINKSWKAYGDKIYTHKGSLFFAPESEGAVELTGIVLPDEYEISFNISSSVINGFVEFGITADQYLPGLYYVEAPSGLRSRYFFRLNGNGKRNIFDSVMFRKQDKKNTERVCFPLIKNLPKKDFYKIHIVMTAKSYRIFCNNRFLSHGPSLFKGGVFNIAYKNIGNNYIQIKDFIIKNIKSIDKENKRKYKEYKLPIP